MVISLKYEPSNFSRLLYVLTSLARGYRSTITNDIFLSLNLYLAGGHHLTTTNDNSYQVLTCLARRDHLTSINGNFT